MAPGTAAGTRILANLGVTDRRSHNYYPRRVTQFLLRREMHLVSTLSPAPGRISCAQSVSSRRRPFGCYAPISSASSMRAGKIVSTSETGASAMGLRHRSIRLRVGVLITVPMPGLLALYGFAPRITLGNVVSQQHASALRNDLINPVAGFQIQLAQERHFALLSLADPTNTEIASALGVQQSRTQHALAALTSALQSPVVTSYAAKPEHTAIGNLITASHSLSGIRGRVADGAISIRAALSAYDAIIGAGFLVLHQALNQQTDVSFVTQGLDVIDLGRAAEATQEEWDLLAADMAQHKFPAADRLVFATLASQRQTMVSDAVPSLDP